MPVTRRRLIAAPALLAFAPLAVAPLSFTTARAQPADPRMAERSLGAVDAKVAVTEWFSLTCTHCAAFQKETFGQVRAKLIDTGRVRYVWRDFPLDQVALTAAMVARALPPERYEPFITALLASQDRWAFARGVNSTEELAKFAALAGLSRASFDATIADAELKRAILTAQDEGEKKFGVHSTPTFVMNGKPISGAVSYDDFVKAVDAATS
jgi:protein-disulfide isomerase